LVFAEGCHWLLPGLHLESFLYDFVLWLVSWNRNVV
jgi:hypothetical protein